MNLRISRGFGIGPRGESGGGAPPPGEGGGGGRGFHPGGPFGGGIPRSIRRGSANTGRKYSIDFSAQFLNLFNNVDYGPPSGNIIPTPNAAGFYVPDARFGKSTSLAGGIFSSGSAVRRIFVQASFEF